MDSKNILIGSCLVLIPGLFSGSCKNKDQEKQFSQNPVQVVAYTVQSENVVYYDDYPATLAALNETQLRSEVNGYVTGIFFREGSHVNKGEKLYEIDRRKYQAAYDAAKANVDIAAGNLQKAQRDADRYVKLDEQNAIAKQVLDDGLTALENSKMQLKLATANLLNAETDYKYSLIIAPFSGLTGFSFVKPGAFVSAGQTLLTTISSDNPIGADFYADQKSLPYFLNLEKNRIADKDSVFRIILPDNTEYQYNGKLSVIDRAVDPTTGTIKIRVVFQNHENYLRPGMNCKLKVLNEGSGTQVVIPAKATIEQMSENMVYIIENNKVSQRRIILGTNLGRLVVVKEGLRPGDKIILDGIQNVREGSLVTFDDHPESRAGANPLANE